MKVKTPTLEEYSGGTIADPASLFPVERERSVRPAGSAASVALIASPEDSGFLSERQTPESRTRQTELFDQDVNVVFVFDGDWRIRAANRAAEKITGYSIAELTERTLWDLVPPRSRLGLKREWLTSTDRNLELEFTTRDGEPRVLQVTWAENAGDRRETEYLAIARDVTGRVTAERFEVARHRVLEMLAADTSLRDILGYLCSILRRELPDSYCTVIVSGFDDPHGYAGGADAGPCDDLARVALVEARNSRLSAVDARTNISLVHLPGSGTGYSWQWKLPLTSAADSSQIIVLRRECGAPESHQAALMVSAAGLLRVVLAHHRLTSQLRHQANHDALTGLPNRLLFRERLPTLIRSAAQQGKMVGILFVDLDDFKLINDSAGHLWGDRVLADVAKRMRGVLGPDTLIARVGGDEFNVIVPDAASLDQIHDVAERLIRCFDDPFEVEGREQFTCATIGASIFPRDGDDPEQLLKHADLALYQAKSEGRSQALFYHRDMGGALTGRLSIQSHLRRATERNEMVLNYQPLYSIGTGKMVGVEALLRWDSLKLGAIAPATFIPVAESSGLIIPLGQWVLENACRQGRLWESKARIPGRIAVNVSQVQFRQPDFLKSVEAMLARTGLDPRYLELELTESIVMRDFAESARKITSLRELGVSISIDDFGTGYSSLSYLEQLPVDTLKIDRSFIQRITEGRPRPALIQAIIGLAHNLGMTVTAEGVETYYQLRVLRDLGCDKVQGFLLGRPSPAGDLGFSLSTEWIGGLSSAATA